MSAIKSVLTVLLTALSLTLVRSTNGMAQVTRIPAPLLIPMVSDTPIGPSTVLVEKDVTLQAGEMRRVFARAEIASSVSTGGGSGNGSVVGAYTLCIGPDGTESQYGGASQNYKGKDTAVGSAYPFPGELALYPLLLFQAPTSGTYKCELLAKAEAGLSALAKSHDELSTTWLQISAADDAGASWWQNLGCDSSGHYNPVTASWCLYLHGASNLQQLYVFGNDGSTAKAWEAPSDAAFVSASDSLMLTTCYYSTGSCTPENSQSWWSRYVLDRGVDGTYVDTHLELIQLDSAHGVCKLTQSAETRAFVDNASHHNMIYHSLANVPVYPGCGSRLFTLRVSAKYVTGLPVKIDGWLWTHAFAFESFKGSAPPIPNLVGLTEGAARTKITASGYTVSSVSSALNAAPAGTVIAQSPSAGVIELSGSAVNFIVSTSGVVVPDLRSLTQSSATNDATSLGLVPRVSFVKDCTNPGEVLSQGPQGGTLVGPGSIVNLTVDSGTPQTCVLK